ncbi:zinc ribbon domain-containing protein [Chloroflexota bacterium]
MRCPKCHFENGEGAMFCGSCSTALGIGQQPSDVNTGKTTSGFKCTNCGALNPGDSIFCESCGSKLVFQEEPVVIRANRQSELTKKTSAAWWLLPVFLGWVGGLVGWVVVRDTDKGKARGILLLGIAMTVISLIIGIGISIAQYYLIDF